LSKLVHTSLTAAEALDNHGISVEVIDAPRLSPLDEETITNSVRKTHRIVVLGEDTPCCGMAANVVSLVARKAFDYLDAAPLMITAPQTLVSFTPFSRITTSPAR
jgi:pyruvate dehydrogenase E1 component beta subunit